MRDLSTLTFHPTTEKIVDLLCEKTQNSNPQFFRMMVCYYICKIAASMRVKIKTTDRGVLPINFYGINLGISGIGKGYSTNIIEDEIIHKFRKRFFEKTLPNIAEKNLQEIARYRTVIQNNNPNKPMGTQVEQEDEYLKVLREYESLGKLAFSFDSGTTAAVKQMRHKLLMANVGSMNLEIDEIGSNLLGNTEVLNTFLELFDVGKVKQKLTKNTKENVRSEEIEGKTPTNLMLFGTPAKLFDGAKIEDEFWSFISTGYGRRCFFGYTKGRGKDASLSAQDIYDKLTNKSSITFLDDLSTKFEQLADIVNVNKHIIANKNISLICIEYMMYCEEEAAKLGDHEHARKAEISHRYFKALKLAGAFAFIDGHGSITEDNLYHAICMAEESGKAFNQMLNQDEAYVRLAKYIADVGHDVTHVDLAENLPFYKGSAQQKAELMRMAVAWGYKNSVIIKHKFENNIEFISGETLEKTNTDELFLSYSDDFAVGYKNVRAPFDKLQNLVTLKNKHWCNHHTTTGRRQEDDITPGFNMLVLDVDGGVSLETVRVLMSKFKYLIHTTKRHTPNTHRFRVILPLNYQIKLNDVDFKEYMNNVYEWLPFDCDVATGQRSRKWATHDKADVYFNDNGELLDGLLFIPRTRKNDDRKKIINTSLELTNVERWFMANTSLGDRNNKIIRYGMMLVDAGYHIADIKLKIDSLNSKIEKPLSDNEINTTIMRSLTRKLDKKGVI